MRGSILYLLLFSFLITMNLSPDLPSPNLFSLSGQNILITGATRGMTVLNYSISPVLNYNQGSVPPVRSPWPKLALPYVLCCAILPAPI